MELQVENVYWIYCTFWTSFDTKNRLKETSARSGFWAAEKPVWILVPPSRRC